MTLKPDSPPAYERSELRGLFLYTDRVRLRARSKEQLGKAASPDFRGLRIQDFHHASGDTRFHSSIAIYEGRQDRAYPHTDPMLNHGLRGSLQVTRTRQASSRAVHLRSSQSSVPLPMIYVVIGIFRRDATLSRIGVCLTMYPSRKLGPPPQAVMYNLLSQLHMGEFSVPGRHNPRLWIIRRS
jgi:hypothetical protein